MRIEVHERMDSVVMEGVSTMHPLSAEDQATLTEHLHQAATILKKYTEPDKLNTFESIEVELREQMLSIVSPTIAEFFWTQSHQQKPPEAPERSEA